MGERCECGCGQIGTDNHHALFGRQKRFPELNAQENLVLVNHDQHIAGTFDTWEWRRYFWKVQCKRYGEENMITWLEGLPAKLSGRVAEFRKMMEA